MVFVDSWRKAPIREETADNAVLDSWRRAPIRECNIYGIYNADSVIWRRAPIREENTDDNYCL